MEKIIPLSVPNIRGNEIKYVNKALESEWVSTAGSMICAFENKIEKYVHINKACAVQSGTAGLHLALLSLGVKPNEEVIVPTLTFIAAVNPVKYINAEPIFMDCDDSLCMDPIKLESFLNNHCVFDGTTVINKATKRIIRCIIVVHVFGNLADMINIMRIAKKFNLSVIEDSTEALGTLYTKGSLKGKYAGTIGDIGVYSFNGNKIITTGGGGMVVSNDLNLIDHIKHLSTQAKSDNVRFIHDEIAFNYRMTNVQAAIGLAQLEQLESFIEVKKRNYDLYKDAFENEVISLIPFREGTRPNYWFYSLNLEKTNHSYEGLMQFLNLNNIQTRPVWSLIHKAQMYKHSEAFNIVNAEKYQKFILNLPCSTNLSDDDVKHVIHYIREALKQGI